MPQRVPLLSVATPHAECVSALTPSTRFDWLAFTSSLPGLFRTQPDTIPAEVPYLHAAADRIARWALPPGMAGAYRVGLVWAGNPRHPGDRWRSIPPAVFLALADVPGAVFCSLQPDVRADGLAAMEAYPQLRRTGAAAADFADTAAIVAQLDLVITVDTAIAHRAGAMARPVWILVPPVPDWHWQRNRSDSPWYPTARLFRQQASEDWSAVIARVRQALIETIASVPALNASVTSGWHCRQARF